MRPHAPSNSFSKALTCLQRRQNHREIELVVQFIKSHIHYHDSVDRVSISPTQQKRPDQTVNTPRRAGQSFKFPQATPKQPCHRYAFSMLRFKAQPPSQHFLPSDLPSLESSLPKTPGRACKRRFTQRVPVPWF
jgi:hypothetical protein